MHRKKLILIVAGVAATVAAGIALRDSRQPAADATSVTAAPAPRPVDAVPPLPVLPPSVKATDPTVALAATYTAEQLRTIERTKSRSPQAQAPGFFIGPDGKQQPIVYNQGMKMDQVEIQRLKATLREDMRANPAAFADIYGLELEDIDAIVAGKRDIPDKLMSDLTM